MIIADPHPGRPRAARAREAREHVRRRAAHVSPTTCSRRCTTRPAWGSPGRRSGSRSGCSCSTTGTDRADRSWRTPMLFEDEGELLEEEGCLSIPGPFYRHSALGGDHVPRPRRRRRPARDDGRRPAGQDLPARDRPPRRHAVHRPVERGRSRAVLAELRRIELGLAEPRQRRRRRRGVGDARAHPGGVPGQRSVVGPDAGASRADRRRRGRPRRHEPAAAGGPGIDAHVHTGRGRRPSGCGFRSSRSSRRPRRAIPDAIALARTRCVRRRGVRRAAPAPACSTRLASAR